MTDINMDSELTPIDKAEHPSHNVPENDSQVLVNGADKLYLDEDCNGQVNEQGSVPRKQNDKIVKELPRMKMGSKDGQLKASEKVPTKKKAEMVASSVNSTKSTTMADAKLRAQQLRSFKAGLQNTKEKEEEEKKRIEDLKTQKQRNAGKRASSVNKPATNTQMPRQQQQKPIPTSGLSLSFQESGTTPRLSRVNSLPRPVKKNSDEAINKLSSHKQISNHLRDTVSQSISSPLGLKKEDASASRQTRLVAQAKHTAVNVKKNSKQITSSKTEIDGNVEANGKSSINSKVVTKVFYEKAMDSNGSNILNKENGSISNVKKNSNQTLVLQIGKKGDRLKANAMVPKSTANDLYNLNSKKSQSLVAKEIALPVSKLNGRSLKAPLDLKGNQKNHPDSAAMQALCNGEESNLYSSAVNINSKEHTDLYVSEKHVNGSKSQNEENNQALKSDYLKTEEDKEQVEGSNLDYSSGKRGEDSITSGNLATRDSTDSLSILKLDRVQQSRDYHATTVDGLVDKGFEIVEATEAASTPLTEVAMSDSPDSRQFDAQPDLSISCQASSLKLQRCDLEAPSEATVVHTSSLDDPASNRFEFSFSPESNIVCEEVCTPKLCNFEFGNPLATVSDSPNASPQLQRTPGLPPLASPAIDNGKLDSAHSRRKWGNSENTAKGFRRLLTFGRKSRNSRAEKDVDSSREGQVNL